VFKNGEAPIRTISSSASMAGRDQTSGPMLASIPFDRIVLPNSPSIRRQNQSRWWPTRYATACVAVTLYSIHLWVRAQLFWRPKKSAVVARCDPLYVDVAIQRWQDFTRRDAILESTAETFNEVAAKRSAPLKRVRRTRSGMCRSFSARPRASTSWCVARLERFPIRLVRIQRQRSS
jgi:hypothetical protein